MEQCVVGLTRHGWAAQCIVYVTKSIVCKNEHRDAIND